MLKLIEDLSSDVLSIDAAAKVRHEGYRNVLIPAAKTKMVQGLIKMLYVAGPDFTGSELEALWDDAAFGFKHWHQLKRIAVVTENAWLRAAIAMSCPFFPSQIQLFKLAELTPRKHGSAAKREQVRDGGSI